MVLTPCYILRFMKQYKIKGFRFQHYIVQKRRFLFFWKTYKDWKSRAYPQKTFDNISEAKNFIAECKCMKPTKKRNKLKYTEYI